MGKKDGGVFASWLKNFTIIVFTQSFHAIYLMVIMKFLSIATGGSMSSSGNFAEMQGLVSIISLVGMMGLIKLEKLIKSVFGIESSNLMGGIGENFGKSMMAIKNGMDLVKRTKEPFDKHKEANKNLEAKRKAYDTAKRRNAAIQNASESNKALAGGNNNSQTTSNQSYNLGAAPAGSAGSGTGGTGAGTGQLTDDALNRLIMALENNSVALQNSNSASNAAAKFDSQENLNNAYKELKDAEKEEEAWRKKRVTRLATTVAAGAMGLGATDDVEKAVTFANLADKPMDWYTDRKVDKHVNLNMAKKVKEEYDATASQRDAAKTKLDNLDESYNVTTNNRTKPVNAKMDAKYKQIRANYQKQYDNLREEAKLQANVAQSYLNDIPQGLVKEMGNTWLEMTDMTPVKISRRDSGRGVKVGIDSSLNKMVRDEAKEAARKIVRRQPNPPRSIDDL